MKMLIHKFHVFWLQRLKYASTKVLIFWLTFLQKYFLKTVFLYLFLYKISTPKWLNLTLKDYDWILSNFHLQKKSGFFNACFNYSGQYSNKIFEDLHLFLCKNSTPLWGPTLAPEIMIWKLLFAISKDVFIPVSAFLAK